MLTVLTFLKNGDKPAEVGPFFQVDPSEFWDHPNIFSGLVLREIRKEFQAPVTPRHITAMLADLDFDDLVIAVVAEDRQKLTFGTCTYRDFVDILKLLATKANSQQIGVALLTSRSAQTQE